MPANQSVKAALDLIEKDKSKVLGVTFGSHKVEPGLYLPRAEAQSAPEVSFNVPSPSGTYILICLDLDAPFVSWPGLGPILHWAQPGVKATAAADGGPATLKWDGVPFVANYIGPAPPPGAAPHRYVFFLYDQPEGFDGKKFAPPNGKTLGPFGRMFFSLDEWEKKAGLGKVLAVNYIKSN